MTKQEKAFFYYEYQWPVAQPGLEDSTSR